MKVAHLFNEINFSGAEIMYAQAAPLFLKQGFKLIAISTGKNIGNYVEQYTEANYTVEHQPLPVGRFNFINFAKYYIKFYHYLKQESIKVIHIHRSDLIMFGIVAWFANVRCIKTQHSTFKNRWFTLHYAITWRFLLRKLFKVTFHTIGESVYLNELNYYKNPSIRINNWFDKSKFYPALDIEEKKRLRLSLNLPDNAFILVSTGGCSVVKNHHDIIRALAKVKDKVDCIYLHLGQGGTEKEEKKLANELGVIKNIKFLGNKDNVRDYLVASNLYIMPSQFEGLGNAALEAMACQLPCVLYNAPGLRDLINNNNNGWLIESDYNLIAEHILDVASNSDSAIAKAKNAFDSVNENYSMTISVQKMIDLYHYK